MWEKFKKIWEDSNENQKIIIAVFLCLTSLVLVISITKMFSPKKALLPLGNIESEYETQEQLSASLKKRLEIFYENELEMKEKQITYIQGEISSIKSKLETL